MTIVDFCYEPINEPAVRELIFPFGCATNDQGYRDIVSIHMYVLYMCSYFCIATSIVDLDVQPHTHTLQMTTYI